MLAREISLCPLHNTFLLPLHLEEMFGVPSPQNAVPIDHFRHHPWGVENSSLLPWTMTQSCLREKTRYLNDFPRGDKRGLSSGFARAPQIGLYHLVADAIPGAVRKT